MKWVLVLLSAVACLWCHQCVNNMFVMVVDNLFSVIHATAANFDGITIEYFS